MTDTADLAEFRLPTTLRAGRPVPNRTARADDAAGPERKAEHAFTVEEDFERCGRPMTMAREGSVVHIALDPGGPAAAAPAPA